MGRGELQEELLHQLREDCLQRDRPGVQDSPGQGLRRPGPRDLQDRVRVRVLDQAGEHDVEDDVVTCETIQDEKCEDETSGYTTQTKCSKWPREVCSVEKKKVKKYTPI